MDQESVRTFLPALRRRLQFFRGRQHRVNARQFSKEKVREAWVLKTAILHRTAAEFYRQMRDWPVREVWSLCEQLLRSGASAELHIALDWAYRRRREFVKSDFRRFEAWLKKYVKDWSGCDDLCTRALGAFLYAYPESATETEAWTRSHNRWVRRAAAVVLIYSLRRGRLLPQALRVAERLLLDEDDLVQKGYGWMLKEASRAYPQQVFRFVMAHKETMPRTVLRYAIEKLPDSQRRKAMLRTTKKK